MSDFRSASPNKTVKVIESWSRVPFPRMPGPCLKGYMGMGVDIAICVVVFLSAVCYAHIGFVRTVISTLQWVLCIALGLLFTDDIEDFIYNTGIGAHMEKSIAASLAAKAEESEAMSSVPGIFSKWAGSAADYAAKETAENITGLILMVFSFLAIIFAVKIVLFVLTHILSKEYNDGPVAFIDSAGGLILGVVLGVFYVLVALAVLVLVMHWLPDTAADTVREYLDNSYFSGIIYDNNPLLMLIKQGFPKGLPKLPI